MVLTALSWIYVLLIVWLCGWLSLDGLRFISQSPQSNVLYLPINFLMGFALVSGLVSYLFIGINMGLLANVVVVSIALLYLFVRRQHVVSLVQQQTASSAQIYREQSVFAWVVVAAIAFFIVLLLFRSSIAVFYTDTSIYHLQYVEWATRYPAIPGLGNFFHRLAFNSQWLLLNAFFSFSFWLNSPLLTLNSLLLLIAVTASVLSGFKLLTGSINFQTLFQTLSFFPLTYFVFNSEVPTASSPSTDLPAALILFAILALIIEYLDQDLEGEDTRLLAASINLLIGFVITIRITMLPVGIFAFYSAYREYQKSTIWHSLRCGLPLVFILLPWLITNVILAGYLLGPVTQLDVVNVDWKVPKQLFIGEQEGIVAWARGFPMKVAEMKQAGWGWVSIWFPGFRLTAEYRYLKWSAIATFIAILFARTALVKQFKHYAIVYGIALCGIVVWFLTAPEPRYAYGFIWGWVLLLATTILLPLLQWLYSQKRTYRITLATTFVCVLVLTFHHQAKTVAYYLQRQTGAAYSVFSLQGGIVTGGDQYRYAYPANSFWIFPMEFPKFPVEQTQLDGQMVYTSPPGLDLCGEAFPCSPYLKGLKTPPLKLELRGKTFRDGFRMSSH